MLQEPKLKEGEKLANSLLLSLDLLVLSEKKLLLSLVTRFNNLRLIRKTLNKLGINKKNWSLNFFALLSHEGKFWS